MKRFMYPATVILGVGQEADKYGHRPRLVYPKPLRHVTHFNSEGMRRKFRAGKVEIGDATHTVPVYRGLDNRAVRVIKNDTRRAAEKSVVEKMMNLVKKNG